MKILALAIVATSLSACSQTTNTSVTRQGATGQYQIESNEPGFVKKNQGHLLDSATTALGLSMGFAEANPLLTGACGANPIAIGACSLGAKKILEKGLITAFGEENSAETLKFTNSASYLAGCSNIALIAGAAFPANIAVGAICAKLYWDAETKKQAAVRTSSLSINANSAAPKN